MQVTHYSLLIIFSLFLLRSSITVESATKNSCNDFIKKSCQVTPYPTLCYSTLSSSYSDNNPNLGDLTYTAIKVSLTKAVHTAKYVAQVGNETTNRDDMAVKDCVELTKDAEWQVRKSLDQMASVLRNGGNDDGDKRRFEVSNVQTWMSAAITDQNTCMDGFSDDFEGRKKKNEDKVKSKVCTKVGLVVKLISNALALVNSFVNNNNHKKT